MLVRDGFSNEAFRDKLVIGKAYKVKVSCGKDDRSADFVRARLVAKYPTYGQFETGHYMEAIQYFDLANGGMQ